MLQMFRPHGRRLSAVTLLGVLLFVLSPTQARAQVVATLNPGDGNRSDSAVREPSARTDSTPDKKPETTEEKLSALEQMLLEQGQRLNQLQQTIAEQQETIRLLASRLTPAEQPATTLAAAGTTQPANAGESQPGQPAQPAQSPSTDDRVKKLEGQVARFGPFRFSGDFRLRADATFRRATTDPEPPLQHVQNVRARYRLRLNLDTDLYPTLSFHMQLATGPINNQLTLDQDFAGAGGKNVSPLVDTIAACLLRRGVSRRAVGNANLG